MSRSFFLCSSRSLRSFSRFLLHVTLLLPLLVAIPALLLARFTLRFRAGVALDLIAHQELLPPPRLLLLALLMLLPLLLGLLPLVLLALRLRGEADARDAGRRPKLLELGRLFVLVRSWTLGS